MGIKTELESEYDYDVVDEFLEYLFVFEASSETTIMSLSKKEHFKDAIEEIYRMFHNLKSACGYLKLEPFVKLLALGEDIFDVARECEGPANEAFVNWVFILRDQLVIWEHELLDDKDFFSPPDRKVIRIPLEIEIKDNKQ